MNVKKKELLGLLLLLSVMWGSCARSNAPLDADEALDYCARQVERALEALQPRDYTMMPRNILAGDTLEGWRCREAIPQEWCSGFWPGVLWMTYDHTGDEALRTEAERYTASLEYMASRPAYDHDLGFIIINSFLKGYELTGDAHYREVALRAADTLATLCNPTVGTMLSWPRHVGDYGGHNTIMDNMINLELLFWAAENGGGNHLRDLAVAHAATTMQHHFRPDGSCYHVAVYDTLTGDFIKGVTHQGYSDESMWSRGQAWAIYGYTMVYRFTRDERFLTHARKVTDCYLQRLAATSDDNIPLWDMDDPRGTAAPKDASAAAIVASALIELAGYVEATDAQRYRTHAEQMLADLSTPQYQCGESSVAFLRHATGHHPAGSEIDASIIYADYYYIEALLRMKKLQK